MVDTHETDVLRGQPPAFTPEEAAVLAAELFGLRGTASPLGSERDQGFMIDDAGGPLGVLKISNASEDPAIVDMETAAALHVCAADPSLPVSAPLWRWGRILQPDRSRTVRARATQTAQRTSFGPPPICPAPPPSTARA
jgi:Ser/Thr protein kinase RdoA (MazF antagonist)